MQMDLVLSPQLKFMVSPWNLSDSSMIVSILNTLPNGGTAPGKHLVTLATSSSFANLKFFTPRIFFSIFESSFLAADITARNILAPSHSNIAFAPLASVTPLIAAASSLVLTGSCCLIYTCNCVKFTP